MHNTSPSLIRRVVPSSSLILRRAGRLPGRRRLHSGLLIRIGSSRIASRRIRGMMIGATSSLTRIHAQVRGGRVALAQNRVYRLLVMMLTVMWHVKRRWRWVAVLWSNAVMKLMWWRSWRVRRDLATRRRRVTRRRYRSWTAHLFFILLILCLYSRVLRPFL